MASTSILRGLLQSRASPTSVDDGQTGSTRTPRLHRQRCIDQWDCSVKKEEEVKNKPQYAKQQNNNNICNTKMEENISKEQFWQYCSEEGVVKREGIETPEGLYYPSRSSSMDSGISSTESGEWNYQEWSYRNVSHTPLSSPCMDTKSQYFIGKKNKMESTYSSLELEALSPQGFVPNEGFMVNSFDSGYSYDGYQLEESLLTPPDAIDLSKIQRGGLSLTDCGGIFADSYNDVNLSLDWLTESVDIPTPDSQDGDVTLASSPTPYTSLTDVTFPLTDVTLPLTDVTSTLSLTPVSSHPPTPLSTSSSSDVDDILSMLSNQASNDSTTYLPSEYSEYLPFDLDNSDSSPNSSNFNSPAPTPVQSPFKSFYTPQEYTTPSFETPLSTAEESSESLTENRKRKASKSSEKVSTKPKRRVSTTSKKERKREQNKTAALRYRQKKKEEKNGCFSQVEHLEAKNAELKKTVSTMITEIKYLQKLWSEVNTTKKQKLEQSLSGIC